MHRIQVKSVDRGAGTFCFKQGLDPVFVEGGIRKDGRLASLGHLLGASKKATSLLDSLAPYKPACFVREPYSF